MEGSEEVLQSIIDLLVAGGYFRARISSLSPFDKLTGGLAWCITASNVDVDFDLFYDDDATLGYKIKVGEAIEGALQKMECPHPLQAHQIQGLDYPAVYPVVQWLVKHVIMTREVLGDQLRKFSHWRFSKNYAFFEERDSELRHESKATNTGLLDHQPKRDYRQDKKAATSEEISDRLLRSTLLDCRHGFTRSRMPKESQISTECQPQFEPSLSPASDGSLSIDEFLSSSRVDHIAAEVRAAESQYLQLIDTQASHKEQAVALLKQIAEEEKDNLILLDQRKEITTQLSKTEEDRKDQERQASELLLETYKLNEMVEKAGVGELLQKLMPLLEQHKMIQKEEVSFHSSCDKKRVELLASIQNLESNIEHSKEIDNYKTEVVNSLQRDGMKLKLLRGDLAKKNQKFLLHRQKLDELPSQSELMQYERCFVELYLHIQAKLQETRKYYASYNALAEANELTLKEISLLNSINAQFEEVMLSQGGRTKFVASMSDISKGVHQKVEKMEARFLVEQSTLSSLKERHSQLVAERRHYASLMKLFQEECARSEALQFSLHPSM